MREDNKPMVPANLINNIVVHGEDESEAFRSQATEFSKVISNNISNFQSIQKPYVMMRVCKIERGRGVHSYVDLQRCSGTAKLVKTD